MLNKDIFVKRSVASKVAIPYICWQQNLPAAFSIAIPFVAPLAKHFQKIVLTLLRQPAK